MGWFRMITPAALPLIEQSERMQTQARQEEGRAAETVPVHHAEAAATLTRGDYGRPTRWVLGLLGTAGATLSILLVTVTLTVTFASSNSFDAPTLIFSVSVGVGAMLIIGAPSVWLLFALHKSGKRLARSAGYWAAYPYRTGQRDPEQRDWFVVRSTVFSADLFLRLVTATLAALIALFGLSVFLRALSGEGDSEFSGTALATAILYFAVAAGQFGGVQRIQNGMLTRDPAPIHRGRQR